MISKVARGSQFNNLIATHDFKLVCSACCVQKNEITYMLQPVIHQCESNILLCKAKTSNKWRPIAERPRYPSPSQYQICWFFMEGFGCVKHKKKCTFARTNEEVTVWNFEKNQGLDHESFLKLVRQRCPGSIQRKSILLENIETLSSLLKTADLKVVCSLCSVKEKMINYSLKSVLHHCCRDILLAKNKNSNIWRRISHQPSLQSPGRNGQYRLCIYFEDGSGCTKYGKDCTFATSHEESMVWNFEKDNNIDHDMLMKMVAQFEENATHTESIVESIFKDFSGEFLELCFGCLHDKPQKFTAKHCNGCCSATAAHAWSPVLVHHVSNQGKDTYHQIQSLTPDCIFEYCTDVRQGKACSCGPPLCQSAHSEVEMAIWKAEENGISIRKELLKLRQNQHSDVGEVAVYCKACRLFLSSHASFTKHCESFEHAQVVAEDQTIRWNCRSPPITHRAEISLCERPTTCLYGNSCPKAHSVEELEEWLMRTIVEKEARHNTEHQDPMSYSERFLEEYRRSSNEVHIISEQIDDVTITCNEELLIRCNEHKARFQWNFQVTTERQLAHVALLKEEPGAFFSLDKRSSTLCTYCPGDMFQKSDTNYEFSVSFEAINSGFYEQWLVLDFDMRPVLLQKLKVRVGEPSTVTIEEPPLKSDSISQGLERWHRGNRVIVLYLDRTEEEEELLKEYKPPQISLQYKSMDEKQSLNHQNYKEQMHSFLYREEMAEDQVVSRLGVCGTMVVSAVPRNGQFTSPQRDLIFIVTLPCTLNPETAEGSVLKRSVKSALIAPLALSGGDNKVYEAIILHGNTAGENELQLQLSERCSSELALKSNQTYEMEVQFQLNRLKFCEMHKAVDLLPDTRIVLPDFSRCGVPVNDSQSITFNANQLAATEYIIGDVGGIIDVAPLLIYGPFGTGKTFTLARAAMELALKPKNRVLICTHTNSSADLYVKDHFHPFTEYGYHGTKPLRIKANKEGIWLYATDKIVLNYCLFSKDGKSFSLPDKAILDDHRIVVTTATMARQLHKLKLPDGYFTHILIDEASQMLECEALMPLSLAGTNTRVVLAGDHMQIGPKLFSVEDDQHSNHTLLNRLFQYYQDQNCDVALKSRIIFNENYRSTKEIVDFIATHFYVGKADIIKAAGNVPGHPRGNALNFHHVRGECHLDSTSMSWYNSAEAAKVVEVVQDTLQHWPLLWGSKDQGSVCVLSNGCQVQYIRIELRKRGLTQVNVENIANVQGKQFRVIIMTAVHSRDSLKSSFIPGLEIFSDPCMLNTAISRAQSQVVVIGDAAALCFFGKCSKMWKSYTDHCISKRSIEPKHLTKDFLENDIKQISKFHKCELHDVPVSQDAILQQLKEEYDQAGSEYTSDEDSLDSQPLVMKNKSQNSSEIERDNLLEICKSQPNKYKRGQLVMETSNTGYLMPFDHPTTRVSLKGRGNIGQCFSGDEVVAEISLRDGIQHGKVVGITKKSDSSNVFVCMMEMENYSGRRRKSTNQFITKVMIPYAKNVPKIRVLISKKCCNDIPVWKHHDGQWKIAYLKPIDEDFKQNNAFVVEVICWKSHCSFPLGNVIRILPMASDGLRILDEEFRQVEPITYSLDMQHSLTTTENYPREDLCNLITFTIDQVTSKNLDDAISVRDMGDHYEIGVHIADVASYVNKGDALDEAAKKFSKMKEPHLFPKNFNEKCSLAPDHNHRAVSLIVKIKKETNELFGEPTFQLSLINSNRQLSYEEAEDIIQKQSTEKTAFETVEDCILTAYHFAKAQRKKRLADWAYSGSCREKRPGKKKAHLMVEELNILFNKCASERLISVDKTQYCTPLRCQAEPDADKVAQLKATYGELVPLSFHAKKIAKCDKQDPKDKSFYVLKKIWEDIKSAAREGTDTDKMVDLIAADDIHPLVLPVVSQFRKCYAEAYFIRSNSSPKARIGHHHLSLKSYTHASSPIRRYIDVVLQRLLHAVICNTPVQYSTQEIDILCHEVEKAIKDEEEYEQKAEMIPFASNLRKQNASKIAFIVNAEPERESFSVSFPFDRVIFPDSIPVMYKYLQLEDEPLYHSEEKCMILQWRRRIYSVNTTQIKLDIKKSQNSSPCIEVPLTIWNDIVDAIDKEDWNKAKSLILNGDTKHLEKVKISQTFEEVSEVDTESCSTEDEHYVDFTVQLKLGDTLEVQMMSKLANGYLKPCIQLACIKPKFEVCLDHAQSPIPCFSQLAKYPTRSWYTDTNEYIDVWKPLCKMESATSAVNGSESIIIEDLVVKFTRQEGNNLKGSFCLPIQCIKHWAIECNLAKCFMCIRKRGLKLTSKPDHSAEMDPLYFTWVAHCVTHKVEKLKKKSSNQVKVEFDVTPLPMESIPECVFQNGTTFTVELIPKPLPESRKEDAVSSIVCANDLVQKIALGHHIQKEATQNEILKWHLLREEPPEGLPKLNDSQIDAVEKALNNNFTLIQGPPGTGKTVLGAYIVYWFLKLNSRTQRKVTIPKDIKKKEVILYCGPSNKCVDVVAEYLLRFRKEMRPLRVYSSQVEMLQYPYPGGTIQSSSRFHRLDHAKPELRSITLHHVIRENQNPFSMQIKEFDERINRAQKREGKELTDDEVEEYKTLIREAQAYEFERHDVILCTCTAASSPNLIRCVSPRQVLIDECAMATEPQTLVPLVCNNPEKIVLIGDHKQLRPIVSNQQAKMMGMQRSLFERYFALFKNRAVMLNTQYRMHADICKFPSDAYYDGKLKTEVVCPESLFLLDHKPKHIVFGDIIGKETSLVVSTNTGNQNSKANHAERDIVVKLAISLVKESKVDERSIVILSPYNAQVSEITASLKKIGLCEITVTTITKSQGSEWRYVIISTVRSLPSEEIESEPDRAWLGKNVGFIGDPNQLNVGITRAKEGLCIIGNQKLLDCSPAWKQLFRHYKANNAITTAEHIFCT